MRSSRTRLSLLLTQAEFKQLCGALEEIYPMGKSFLMLVAINAGVMQPDHPVPRTKRDCRVRFWLPRRLAVKIRELSKLKGTSQQNLMRHYLFQYIAHPPWKEDNFF
jgi:hypothetical protein